MKPKHIILSVLVLFTIIFTTASFAATQQEQTIMIALNTNLGDIEIELNAEKAPASVENFLSYAREGFYNGTIFHRVIPNFMIQGGGFESGLKQKDTKASLQNEANNGLKNITGSIAMARTNDPHSATAQFFINVADNDFLNFSSETSRGWGYAVFGKVTAGMEVVSKIAAVETGMSGHFSDVPSEEIIIESVTIND